jgi:hypothetical protein
VLLHLAPLISGRKPEELSVGEGTRA